MNPEFTSEFFAGNREKLRQLFTGTAPIVITANGQMQRNGDNTYPFRQDSSFWYLTGVNYPDVTLVIDKDKEYFIVPERDYFREAFDGAITADEVQQLSGVAAVLGGKDGWNQLAKRLKRAKHVATLGASPKYAEWDGFYSNPARAELIEKLKGYNAAIEVLDLREHLMRMRSIKQPAEIAMIQAAIDVTIEGLQYITAKDRLNSYASENEVEADLTRQFRRAGYGHAFAPIISHGKNTTRIHYLGGTDKLKSGELLMFDIGAEASMYAADVARTIVIGDTPTKRQQAVYDAVCEAQDYAYSLLKPGTVYMDYEKAVETFIGEKLRSLGLIKTIDHDAVRHYFPHRTSHFLGLDAHDVGDYSGAMVPGMVFACEPGIYIPEEGIGVRIEDDVLITETGNQILSASMPRQLSLQ